MSFDDFEHQARLFVLGALEEDEAAQFDAARREHGPRAEEFIRECERLKAVFALTLQPHPPKQDAKARLMALVRESLARKVGGDRPVSHGNNGA